MRRNTDAEFVGLPRLKQQHGWQLARFEKWAAARKWISFHMAHYDWWMFPIDRPSRFGYAWTVLADDVAELKEDEAFVRGYLRGVELLALAWGWDLNARDYVPNPDKMQYWVNHPIRLYKCLRSLNLFGYGTPFESLCLFARDLMAQGEEMACRDYDVREFLRDAGRNDFGI